MSTDHKSETSHHEVVDENANANANATGDASSPPRSTWDALRDNPWVVLFCLYGNIGALMYGFDNLVLSLALSMTAFETTFGTWTAGAYVIPAYWQSLWNALSQVATMLGATAAGPLQDRFGRRAAFLVAACLSAAGIAVVYTAATPGAFLAGKIVNGLALGLALTTGQTYISEVTALELRGIALSGFTFCMNLGYLIAASVALPRMSMASDAAYKVLFASGWVWPGVILLFLPFMPESPYFLVMNGQHDQAGRMLRRLGHQASEAVILLDDIVRTHTEEQLRTQAARESSFRDCFRGTNWRRTRIILYCNALSQVIGSSFMTNGPYFLVQAGMSSAKTGMMTEIGIAFGIASSLVTGYLMTVCGRRRLILFGIGLSTGLFTVMGIAGCFPHSSPALWVVGIFLELSWWVYGPAIGPAMAIAGEVSAVRLRAKSLAVGFTFNYFFSTVWNVVMPYLYNSDEADLGGLIGWIFAGLGAISLGVLFVELPETKGRSFEELDEMLTAGVPTRAFPGSVGSPSSRIVGKYTVDPLGTLSGMIT
ncbi:MFS general substrate transporter [Aspergillus heteromorphus CBS 117.55]|uniref:MFS general substrate transporter n=1 Tax=Aspergillus heteromorphus CBS 117.55 TaxID=1448321 RepID=A0A317VN54_9EURO|nr:MFS general substrate transporter [Aspergillus heteromorphus CBS 117.55]PWY75355.1 MFS general substrate transporter [Aspergillus heteromorphus CBS 117.55]